MSTITMWKTTEPLKPVNRYGIRRSRDERHIKYRWREREIITSVCRWLAISAFIGCWVASSLLVYSDVDLVKSLTQNPQFRSVHKTQATPLLVTTGTALYYDINNVLTSDVTPLKSVETIPSLAAMEASLYVENNPRCSITLLVDSHHPLYLIIVSNSVILIRDTHSSYEERHLYISGAQSVLYSEHDSTVVYFPEANVKISSPFWESTAMHASNEEMLSSRMKLLESSVSTDVDFDFNNRRITISHLRVETAVYTSPESIISKFSYQLDDGNFISYCLTTSFQLIKISSTSSRFAGISAESTTDGNVNIIPRGGCANHQTVSPGLLMYIQGVGKAIPLHSPWGTYYNINPAVVTRPGMVCVL